MPVTVFARSKEDQSTSTRHVAPHVSLDQPADVVLAPDTPAIRSFDKSGSDLDLVFEDGQRLHIQDFFVVGSDGNFSSLIDAAGTPQLSGLMAPEPDRPGEIRLEPGAEGEAVARYGDERAKAADSEDDAAWLDPLRLTGAGLATGLGFFDFGMGPEDGAASGASAPRAQSAGLAEDVEALTGSDTALDLDETPDGTNIPDPIATEPTPLADGPGMLPSSPDLLLSMADSPELALLPEPTEGDT